jgi:hypothetical protein
MTANRAAADPSRRMRLIVPLLLLERGGQIPPQPLQI